MVHVQRGTENARMPVLNVPNPWLCTQAKVKAEATTQKLEFEEVYADNLMDFMSDWFTHCGEKQRHL